jgi:hypothetical protein
MREEVKPGSRRLGQLFRPRGAEARKIMRTNLYAHTEAHHPYPAFVSVNREEDGRVTMTVRERGHNGEKMATIELTEERLDEMGMTFLDVRNVPPGFDERASAAIQQALDRYASAKGGA